MEDKKVHIVFDIGEYEQKVIDFQKLLDISSKSKASDEDIEELSEDIKKKWWAEIKGVSLVKAVIDTKYYFFSSFKIC
jgi:diphthamide synthase (EF-2-diphthine--ammonia ligase)